MPYASEQDLVDAYGADRILMLAMAANGTRDEAKITRCLDGASAVIDGYLSLRYTLPLSVAPPLLKDACVVIAAYRLASDPAALSEDMRKRYEDAIAFLKDVARGFAGIGVATTAQQQAANAAATPSPFAGPQVVVEESVPRMFSRRLLRSV